MNTAGKCLAELFLVSIRRVFWYGLVGARETGGDGECMVKSVFSLRLSGFCGLSVVLPLPNGVVWTYLIWVKRYTCHNMYERT